MYGYDEEQVLGFCDDAAAAYASVGHGIDAASGVWVARMQYDALGLGYPAARSKQLALLTQALPSGDPVAASAAMVDVAAVTTAGAVTAYDEAQVMGFISDGGAAYATAEHPLDAASWVWVGRMQYDAGASLGYPSARKKQLAALQTALGVAPPTPVPPTPGEFRPAPREWHGQMGGVHVASLPAIYWGPSDPTLVLSWLYDRYDDPQRADIRAAWHARGYTHVVLSWPDAQSFNPSPDRFRDIVLELIAGGFFPLVMWCSKDFDAPNVDAILANIEAPLTLLTGILPMCCIGWELSLWLSPTQVQQLIDAIAPRCVAWGCRVYVHFQQGYGSFQQENMFFHHFWELQVGKLTGLLHQRILGTTPEEYRGASGGIVDILERFAGHFGCPADSGFGHPFDMVCWEVTCMNQFDGSVTETQGDAWGTWAQQTPPSHGPAGAVGVIGTGNGRLPNTTRVVAFTRRPKPDPCERPWRETVGRLADVRAKG